MLAEHTFSAPRLYHLVLIDRLAATNARRFQKAMKALGRKLTGEGIDFEWRACVEQDDEKGLHFHVFVLAEARRFNPCRWLNHKADGWLRGMIDGQAMDFHLSAPKAEMHRRQTDGRRLNYAAPTKGDKLADCMEWISYLAKARSKPVGITPIYFSSRAKRGQA